MHLHSGHILLFVLFIVLMLPHSQHTTLYSFIVVYFIDVIYCSAVIAITPLFIYLYLYYIIVLYYCRYLWIHLIIVFYYWYLWIHFTTGEYFYQSSKYKACKARIMLTSSHSMANEVFKLRLEVVRCMTTTVHTLVIRHTFHKLPMVASLLRSVIRYHSFLRSLRKMFYLHNR
jgi:hypothetical protein